MYESLGMNILRRGNDTVIVITCLNPLVPGVH